MEQQTGTQWTIRPAREADYRATRMLLPEAVHFGSRPNVLLAERAQQHILAAAAWSPRFQTEGLTGARVAVHVVPPWRRRGIATALLDAIATAVRPWGAQALFAWRPIRTGGEDERCWRMLHFNRQSTTSVSTADMARAEAYLRPMYEQLVARQWIPAEAKLIPLARADLPQIAALHARYLGGRAQQVLARLSGQTVEPFDTAISPVLILHGAVRAFTLVRLIGSQCHVESTVVDPALRGGWANLWLKYEGIRWAIAAGAKTMIFQTFARHKDTRKLAKQMDAVTEELIEPYRLLI